MVRCLFDRSAGGRSCAAAGWPMQAALLWVRGEVEGWDAAGEGEVERKVGVEVSWWRG